MENKYDFKLRLKRIRNFSHLRYCVDRLCRTDIGQEWTNEQTDNNAYIFEIDGELKFAAALDRKSREAFKHLIIKNIKEEAAQAMLPESEISKKIKRIYSEYQDKSVSKFTGEVRQHTTELMRIINIGLPKHKFLCGVVHTDQLGKYMHIHLLYLEN